MPAESRRPLLAVGVKKYNVPITLKKSADVGVAVAPVVPAVVGFPVFKAIATLIGVTIAGVGTYHVVTNPSTDIFDVDTAYIQALYGMTPREASAVNTSGFNIVYRGQVANTLQEIREYACLGHTRHYFNVHAPVRAGMHNSRGVAYRFLDKSLPFKALNSSAYVEVTHCGGSNFESNATWHYVVRGSGLFVLVGNTIAFETHEQAVQFFLGHGCRDKANTDHRSNPQCDYELTPTLNRALQIGYKSVQFTGHCDANCNFCGHELVILGHDGGTTCPTGLTYYSSSGAACECVEWGSSLRGRCAMCKSTAQALDQNELGRFWPQKRTNVSDTWRHVCSLEEKREMAMSKVSLNRTCSNMEECLENLKRTIDARQTLHNRSTVVQIDENAFDICIEFHNETRFCELGYGPSGPISKKACIAPSSCYRFKLNTILDWVRSMAAIKKSYSVCNVAMRGHSLTCDGIEKTDGHSIVYAHEGYSFWESLQLRFYMFKFADIYKMIGTSHSGGILLTYGLMSCKDLHIYGMGLYSNETDFIYQHYYDPTITDTCVNECWKGDFMLSNSTTKDRNFFHNNHDQVCRPWTECDAPQTGVPATENQIDFFVKSELKLHILHAFGVIKWHL